MNRTDSSELPPELQRTLRKAGRLEWLTIAYLLSAVVLLGLVLGNSQAMKTAWAEDLLSLIPPIAFLIATRLNVRPPTGRFPYGFHRATSLAHLCSALALFTMGTYLLIEALLQLVTAEYPTIGSVELFGQTLWLGWLMLPALAWSAVPAVFLGRAKFSLAEELHNKVLYADSKMNKADWLTASAAMVGVVGIGFGLWWADAVAAALISLDITHDGFSNLRRRGPHGPDTHHHRPGQRRPAARQARLDATKARLGKRGGGAPAGGGAGVLRGSLRGALRRDKHHGEDRRRPEAGSRSRLENL
jgi:cation diffusion facilitator family transporter